MKEREQASEVLKQSRLVGITRLGIKTTTIIMLSTLIDEVDSMKEQITM